MDVIRAPLSIQARRDQTRSWRGRGAVRSGSGRVRRRGSGVDGDCGPSQTFDVERGGYLVGAAVDVDAKLAPLDPALVAFAGAVLAWTAVAHRLRRSTSSVAATWSAAVDVDANRAAYRRTSSRLAPLRSAPRR